MASLTWREALRAVSVEAARRAANSKPMPGGPSDDRYLGERAGAQYAFNVIAEEFGYLADETAMGCPSKEALTKLRKMLDEDR